MYEWKNALIFRGSFGRDLLPKSIYQRVSCNTKTPLHILRSQNHYHPEVRFYLTLYNKAEKCLHQNQCFDGGIE